MNTDTQQKIEGKEHFHGSDLEKIEKYFGIPWFFAPPEGSADA